MNSRHNTVIYLVVELKKIEIKVNQNRKEMSSQRNLEKHLPTEELSTIVENRIQNICLKTIDVITRFYYLHCVLFSEGIIESFSNLINS